MYNHWVFDDEQLEAYKKKIKADAIDEYKLKLLNAKSEKVKDIHSAEIWVEFKRQATMIAEQLKENNNDRGKQAES